MPPKKPLTEKEVSNAKAIGKLFDGGGLYLELTASGGKYWRMKYRRPTGKENRLAFGVYPEVKLREAREKREEARRLLAQGVDPSMAARKAREGNTARAINTFEAVSREWFGRFMTEKAESHPQRVMRAFERDLWPWLGGRPVSEIDAEELLGVLRRIEERGAIETAHRVRQTCGQVFRYAIATGRAKRDVSADLKGAIAPAKGEHFAATLEPLRLGEIVAAMWNYRGSPQVAAALRLAPMLFPRPGELRKAQWPEMDLEAAEWRYKVTKTGVDHIVPLPRQAITVLRDLHRLTGRGSYVFPGGRSAARPMSDNGVLAALRALGIGQKEMTGHGFRAVARTLLEEMLGFRYDIIEHQLAHAVRDPNGRAYNRTAHLPERREMMQKWADYLDELRLQPGAAGAKAGLHLLSA